MSEKRDRIKELYIDTNPERAEILPVEWSPLHKTCCRLCCGCHVPASLQLNGLHPQGRSLLQQTKFRRLRDAFVVEIWQLEINTMQIFSNLLAHSTVNLHFELCWTAENLFPAIFIFFKCVESHGLHYSTLASYYCTILFAPVILPISSIRIISFYLISCPWPFPLNVPVTICSVCFSGMISMIQLIKICSVCLLLCVLCTSACCSPALLNDSRSPQRDDFASYASDSCEKWFGWE